MSDDFYPVTDLDGSPRPARGNTSPSGAPWLARLGLVAGSLGLAFGIGAFGAGHLATAGHEPAATTTQGPAPGQDAAPDHQPGAAAEAPAEHWEQDD
jgi:hypothetical protein